jgi:integrase
MPLKLVRRPNTPTWVIRGTLRGVRVEESTGTGNRTAAEEICAKRETEILKASIYGRAATASFAEAALSYLQQGGSRKFLQPVIQYFKTTPLAKIDQDAIEEGAGKLFPNASPATRNRNFYTPTLAVLHHAARKKLCARPIVKRPKPSKARVRWLTIEEADRLITGARVGEGLWLDWRNVDLARAHVTFTETKNGEARGVPLHQRVIAALANLPHRDGEVFRRPDGLPYVRSKGINDTSAGTRIKTAFRRAVVRAGLEDFHPHDCRHTWATWHYAKNRDLGALMKLGGWKSTAMVMRYAQNPWTLFAACSVRQTRLQYPRMASGPAASLSSIRGRESPVFTMRTSSHDTAGVF